MRKRILSAAVVLICLGFLLGAATRACTAAEPPLLSTTDLVEHSYQWDGKAVAFRGELLEEVMKRSDGVWLNLSDGNNTAMGVFVPAGVTLPDLVWAENYRTTGDTVYITGIFHRACAAHQGETDIHATSVTVVAQGHSKPNPIRPDRVVWFFVLAMALAVILRLYYHPQRSAGRGRPQ